MTITEAMEILKLYTKGVPKANHTDFEDALYLGIEALKHLERERLDHCEPYGELLPGETEE